MKARATKQRRTKHGRRTDHDATPEAIAELLDHGTLSDWGPLLAEVRRDADGPVADRILAQLDDHDHGQADAFWRSLIAQAREDRDRRSIPQRQG